MADNPISSTAADAELKRVAAACLFLACKVEEATVRTNDLLNAVHFVAGAVQQLDSAVPSCNLLPKTSEFEAIVGQEYYALKETLITDEQLLLRTINFDIVVEHPHKYLFNFGKLINAKFKLIQMAVSILNDSIVLTKLCLAYPPADIAAACLQVASELSYPLQLPIVNSPSDWGALGVKPQNVDLIGLALLDVIVSNMEPG